MPTGLPSLTPTDLELQAELANAKQIVELAPGGSYKTVVRTPGMADATFWSNLAYYLTYVAAAAKIKPGDQAGVNAWLRINAEVNRLILAKVPASPAWNSKKATWPLPTPPKDWGPGGAFAARRPWPKDKVQTRKHIGIDLAAGPGTPILATEGGTVVAAESGWEMVKDKETGQWRGVKCLVMVTDSGLTLLFGGTRPGSALVQDGQRVEAGQQLAEVGTYPLGDSMLHMSGYDKVLTIGEVNARKEWKLGEAAPKNLLDLSAYLKAAAANPKAAAQQGLVQEGSGGGALVDNHGSDGEMDEGTPAGDPEDEDNPTPASASSGGGAGMAIAAGGLGLAVVGIGAWLASRKRKRRAA